MDALSDILSLVRVGNPVSRQLVGGGAWRLDFPAYTGLKFNAVVEGACWVQLDGQDEPIRCGPGSCFLMSRGTPFRMWSCPDAEPQDAAKVYGAATGEGIARINDETGFSLFGSRFVCEGPNADVLLSALPAIAFLTGERDRSKLVFLLQTIRDELLEEEPGSILATEHLAHMMLIQALRLYFRDAHHAEGWLPALADRKIGKAINLMHAEPARKWTLQDLAKAVGMSRTSFAVRFKEKVGVSAIDYLLRWRMSLAKDYLACRSASITTISSTLGYESESAFGAAFKRSVGCSPRTYSRSVAQANI
ncbi:AraC family transcriptional regulator [Roseibium litorale]|uniref:AraC family transcriptional regulator n=1 Tax=Roseibium litorale TaxID=2803841 RepID=A0ABR9CPP7_9HYPH|nr:AraC family transcriptional regulator [Roseibium litorale]MBD8892648.1 AraC family transcriptional regulator [Roseibium litorale]